MPKGLNVDTDLDGMLTAADEDEGHGHHLQARYLRNGADEIASLRARVLEMERIIEAAKSGDCVEYNSGVAAERKRCAKVARLAKYDMPASDITNYYDGWDDACEDILAAIERGDA